MSSVDQAARRNAVSYRCSSCSNSFIDFGETAAAEINCSCGAALTRMALSSGLYAVKEPIAPEVRATSPGAPPIPKEPDGGYGASHGYDVTHGGPSGPGDAPAPVPESST